MSVKCYKKITVNLECYIQLNYPNEVDKSTNKINK